MCKVIWSWSQFQNNVWDDIWFVTKRMQDRENDDLKQLGSFIYNKMGHATLCQLWTNPIGLYFQAQGTSVRWREDQTETDSVWRLSGTFAHCGTFYASIFDVSNVQASNPGNGIDCSIGRLFLSFDEFNELADDQ